MTAKAIHMEILFFIIDDDTLKMVHQYYTLLMIHDIGFSYFLLRFIKTRELFPECLRIVFNNCVCAP